MFYGRAAGHDALFSLGLEYNEDDDWNLLPSKGAGRGHSWEVKDQRYWCLPFLVPKGKAGEAFAYRVIFTSPMGPSVPICTLRPMFDGACDKGYLATSRNIACRVCSIVLLVAY